MNADASSDPVLAERRGACRALDLLMSGRVVLGEEAQAIGLVDQLVEPEALVDAAVAYADSERLIVESFERPDVREGVDSYPQKRPPQIPPLADR